MTSLNNPSKPSYLPRRDKCSSCKNPVFLAERILVDSKVFHRVCFSCARCGARLNPDSCDYYECESGDYCCESCPGDSIQSSANEDASQSNMSPSEGQPDLLLSDDQKMSNRNTAEPILPVINISENSDSTMSIDYSRTPKNDSVVLTRMKFFENSMLSANEISKSKSGLHQSDGSTGLLNNALIETISDSKCDVANGENDVSDNKKVKFSSSTIVIDSDSIDNNVVSDNTSKDGNSGDGIVIESSNEASTKPEISEVMSKDVIHISSSSIVSSDNVDEQSSLSRSEESGLYSNSSSNVSNVNEENSNILSNDNVSLETQSSEGQKTKMDHIFTSTLASFGNENSKMRNDVSSSFSLDSSYEILKGKSTTFDESVFTNKTSSENIDSGELLKDETTKNEALEVNIIGITDISILEDTKKSNHAEIEKSNLIQIQSSKVSGDEEILNNPEIVKDTSNDHHDTSLLANAATSSMETKVSTSICNVSSEESKANVDSSRDEYPEELNPFGEDEYTSDLDASNPFFDSVNNSSENTSSVKPNQRRKIPVDNPFWSDEDYSSSSDEEMDIPVPAPRTLTTSAIPRASPRSIKSPEITNNGLKTSSPSPSKRKKQPAPPPPVQSSPSKPSARKTRPAPLPPLITIQSPNNIHTSTPMFEENTNLSKLLTKCNISDVKQSPVVQKWDNCKSDKDEDNRTRKSSDGVPTNKYLNNDKQAAGKYKRKKGPAPSMPVTRRSVTPLPIADIKHELEIIELQQQGLEKQGVKLEQMIRLKCEGEANINDNSTGSLETCAMGMTDEEVDDLVLQLFEIVNEKNELFRRQAQLMYMRRQQRLEEEHADLEYQIRCLMAQPETNRTDSDKQLEEQLLSRLLEVVSMRNEVVDCLEMDRVRAVEEDLSISSRLESYTAQREQNEDANSNQKSSPMKLSKKEKKKEKEKKKLRKFNKKQDLDKDIDETELNEALKTNKTLKDKRKLKWFS